MDQDYYLKVGRAADLEHLAERILYRFFEIFPGLLSWGTLGVIFLAVWISPVFVAVLSVGLFLYWIVHSFFLLFCLRRGYERMRIHEKKDWLKELDALTHSNEKIILRNWNDLYHLVVIPTYKEPVSVLRETFLALEESDYPKEKMIVVLAIEERAGNEGIQKAALISEEFGACFYRFLIAVHPQDIPGEILGKGANETWALRQAKTKIIDPFHIPYEYVIVTSLDADTKVFPKYFGCLTYHYLTSSDPLHRSFQPVPLFLNNISQAPAISRLFAFFTTLWYLINQERSEKLVTFSSHSMSFKALVEVDFKQTNVVSDDSRIFWQCFLKYDGDYSVQPLYYPVSMDANMAPSWWSTVVQIYKQQRRWAYGVTDIPYFLFGFWKNKNIPLSKKISLGRELIEGHWARATIPLLLFFNAGLGILLANNAVFQSLFSSYSSRLFFWILIFAFVGLGAFFLFTVWFLPAPLRYQKGRAVLLEWLLLPIVFVLFSTPALEAQLRLAFGRYLGFWPTPKMQPPRA